MRMSLTNGRIPTTLTYFGRSRGNFSNTGSGTGFQPCFSLNPLKETSKRLKYSIKYIYIYIYVHMPI